MALSFRSLSCAILIAALPLLGGCEGSDDEGALSIALAEAAARSQPGASSRRAAGELVHSPAADALRAASGDGLVTFDAEGRVQPALAESWIVTADGRSYIFRLRDAVPGEAPPATAIAARDALRSAMRRLRGTPLSLDLAVIEEVRAMTGRVLEIRLAAPFPELLQLLAQPQLVLTEEAGGNFVLEQEGDRARLVPVRGNRDGELADASQPRQRTLELRLASPRRAVELFNAGTVDVMLGGAVDGLPHVELGGLLRGSIRLDPVSGLFGLLVSRDVDGFLSEPANREALAMTIDREALIEPFGIGGWVPSTRIVAAGLADDLGTIGERWSDLSLEDRRTLAAARVASWRGSESELPPVTIALPEGRGGELLFERLRGSFEAIGVAARRVGLAGPADLRLVDLNASFARADWYLNRLNCGVTQAVCSPQADALVAEARGENDPAERAALFAEAEAELTSTNGFIPFGPPLRFSLVRGTVTGFAVNRWGVHPLSQLALIPS